MRVLGVLTVAVCLLKVAVGMPENSGLGAGEKEERLMLEVDAELSDQADVVESEESIGENLDDTPVTAEDDEELDDVQEEGAYYRPLIIVNQCGSYGKKFVDRIKSLSSYMSEITVECGNCTSISLKGNVNANVEFCTRATRGLSVARK